MKKLTILLFVMGMTFLTACHKEQEIKTPQGHAVLMYFPWADNLYSYFLDNISDIKTAMAAGKGAANTRVLVLLATGSNNGRLSELVYNNGTCEERQLKTYSNWSFSKKENIKEMFNDMAAYVNAETYSMVIGAHGSGWLPKECSPNKARSFGGQTIDTKTNVETLDSAIVESSIKHLNFLCFDDCYMANIETAYCLRNATDYLIASTSEIMSPGLPYNDIWQYVSSTTPDYRSIVDGFHSFYTSYVYYPCGALSVTDCSQMDYASTAMKELNSMMAEYGIQPTDFTPQRLDGFSYTVFFDMKDYTDKVLEALQEKGANTSSLAINSLYNNIIIAHSCTPYLFSEYLSAFSSKTYPVASNCGITISDPSKNNQATAYIENTEWYKATHLLN